MVLGPLIFEDRLNRKKLRQGTLCGSKEAFLAWTNRQTPCHLSSGKRQAWYIVQEVEIDDNGLMQGVVRYKTYSVEWELIGQSYRI